MAQEHYIQAANRRLPTQLYGEIQPDKTTLVFLHWAIDGIDMWHDFPQQAHEQTNPPVIVYERWGHGKSEPLTVFRQGDTQPEEANGPLNDLFQHDDLKKVALIGHSYGGMISLIAASYHAETIQGVVSIVPQMVIHSLCVNGVNDAKNAFENGNLREKLYKFHGEGTDILFYDWVHRVHDETYQKQDCSSFLSQIAWPVLQIYCKDNVFGYLPNLELSKTHISEDLSIIEIPNAGHYVHLEATKIVINDIKAFCLTI